MGSNLDGDLSELIESARTGSHMAIDALLGRHRPQIKRMVAVRIDPRVSSRVDASDVVQEALVLAAQRLQAYLKEPAIPFYPWLRQIAWNCLIDVHRRHVGALGRSVTREDFEPAISDESVCKLAGLVEDQQPGPSSRLLRKESMQQVRTALAQLPSALRETLELRHLEQLSTKQASEVLGISEAAVKMRHLRAMQSLRKIMKELLGKDQS